MPSPSQDTVACTCPSCGNLFAVKASFLGRQVKCPICTASVTATPEEQPTPETEEQDAVTAVKREEAHSASPGRMPEAAEKAPGTPAPAAGTPPPSTDAAPRVPLAPKKKTDKRAISVHAPSLPGPAGPTTKIRKRKEENAAPAIAAPRSASLAPEEPEYQPTAADIARSERRATWHIWLFVSGLILLLLGMFMFLRGRDMEAASSQILNISDRFVDHEALFSQEVNKDLLEKLQQRERQYRLIAHSRREEDRKAESISPHITAAMNELSL